MQVWRVNYVDTLKGSRSVLTSQMQALLRWDRSLYYHRIKLRPFDLSINLLMNDVQIVIRVLNLPLINYVVRHDYDSEGNVRLGEGGFRDIPLPRMMITCIYSGQQA